MILPLGADFRHGLAAAIPRLRVHALALARDPTLADDLVQDTVLKAWANRAGFVPGSNLSAWLHTILRNTFLSTLRKTRREVQDVNGAYALTLTEGPAHETRLAMQDFLRAFHRLAPEHREVLMLVGVAGLSTDEAAAIIGVPPGTVKSRASRARRRLASHMAPGDLSPPTT